MPKAPRTRLDEIRLARNLRAAELARRAGMDPSHLHRIITGKIRLTENQGRALARALFVPPETLYAKIGADIPVSSEQAPPAPFPSRPYHPEHAPAVIGRRLHALLADIGLTIEETAQQIGATEEDARDWLAGRVRPPPLLMDRLARRAGITLAWLYFGDASGLLPGVAARLQKLFPPD
jgi:transcriptional regulator with XRE-family HTH domain